MRGAKQVNERKPGPVPQRRGEPEKAEQGARIRLRGTYETLYATVLQTAVGCNGRMALILTDAGYKTTVRTDGRGNIVE